MSGVTVEKMRPGYVAPSMPTRPPLGSEIVLPPIRLGFFYDAVYQFREDLLLDFYNNHTIPRPPDVSIPYPSAGIDPSALQELERLIKSSGSSDIPSFIVAIGRPTLEFKPDDSLVLIERWPLHITFYVGERELARYRGSLRINGTINIEINPTGYSFRLVVRHFTSDMSLENHDTMLKYIFEANRSAFETVFARPETSPLYLTSSLSPFRSLRQGEVIRDIRNPRDWRIDLAKVSEPAGSRRRAIACCLVLTPDADLSSTSSIRYNLGDRNFHYDVSERLIRRAIYLVWNRADTPKTARDTNVFVNLIRSNSEEIPAQATINVAFTRLSIADLYIFDSLTVDVIRLVTDAALSVERMRERGGGMREIELPEEMRNGLVNYAISITPFDEPSVDPGASPGMHLVNEITKKCVNLVCVPFIEETTSINNLLGTVSATRHYMSYAGNLNWGGV
jgi:hypothetical protein